MEMISCAQSVDVLKQHKHYSNAASLGKHHMQMRKELGGNAALEISDRK